MATTLLEGAKILNESLRAIGYNFQIDTTDNTTITADIERIGITDPEQVNAVLKQMNLIVTHRNFGAIFNSEKNKLRAFMVEHSEQGFGIEDLFHELIDGYSPLWDKAGTAEEIAENLFSYDNNKIHKTFHVHGISHQVDTTIDLRNYDKLFTARGVTNFIDVKLANLSWSMEAWLMDRIIEIIQTMISDERVIFSQNNDINTIQGVRNTVENIKTTVEGFSTLNSLYNYGAWDETINSFRSLRNISDPEDVFIVTTPANMQRLKVQGYANAYNLSEFELKGKIIYLPAGTVLGEYDDEEVLYLIMDRRTIVTAIRFWRGSAQYIPNVFQSHNFLTSEILAGYNTFFNCVAVCGPEIEPISDDSGDEKKNNVSLIVSVASGYEFFLDYTLVNGNIIGEQFDENWVLLGEKLTHSIIGYVGSEQIKSFSTIETSAEPIQAIVKINGIDIEGSPFRTVPLNISDNSQVYISLST